MLKGLNRRMARHSHLEMRRGNGVAWRFAEIDN